MYSISRSVVVGVLCLWACLAFSGCAKEEVVSSKLHVWVTIQPQKFMVEAIGGDFVDVQVLVRPGMSPETYAPTVQEMGRLAKADAYFGIGMPLEKTIFQKISGTNQRTLIVEAEIPVSHTENHQHHAGCVHGDQDPHIWMDPVKMIAFSFEVEDALKQLSPDDSAVFTVNAEALREKLKHLDATLTAQLLPYVGRAFYINHPSLGHFAERYGLVQFSIEQAGSSPSARRVADIIQSAKEDRVGAIFTQPEFGRSSADILAQALGLDVVEVNPLAVDYIENMLHIGQQLKESFGND